MLCVLLLILATTAVAACQSDAPVPQVMGVPVCGYEVVNRYPHSADAYTQGLIYNQGRLIESTGIEGQSSLRDVELETGAVLRRVDLSDEYFAEGIALVGTQVRLLTWTSEEGFVYDLESFAEVGRFEYEGEGWGLAFDGNDLLMSDGSSQLTRRDSDSFSVLRTLAVTSGGEPVTRLNELELIGGELWANVWQTDRIARIDPETGQVESWVDLAGLLSDDDRTPTTSVLNGIAYDEAGDRIFVTGKYWPWLFHIRVVGCGD